MAVRILFCRILYDGGNKKILGAIKHQELFDLLYKAVIYLYGRNVIFPYRGPSKEKSTTGSKSQKGETSRDETIRKTQV